MANDKKLYKRGEAKEGELLTKPVITKQFKEEAGEKAAKKYSKAKKSCRILLEDVAKWIWKPWKQHRWLK